MNNAVSKLNRSLKLSRNTPVGELPPLNDKTIRALLQKESVRKKIV